MSIEWVMALIFLPIIGLLIWLGVTLCRTDTENWERVTKAPKFIIRPSYDLGFDIWEKTLFPLPGRSPFMSYRPLWGHYKTYDEAEAQLRHYAKSNVGKSDE